MSSQNVVSANANVVTNAAGQNWHYCFLEYSELIFSAASTQYWYWYEKYKTLDTCTSHLCLWSLCIKVCRAAFPENIFLCDWMLRHYKNTQLPKKVPYVSLPLVSFMWPRFVPHFHNRPRGNTGTCVVDTGVSLSTDTSPLPLNGKPLGWLISCRARKWEGGQCTEWAGGDVTQQEKKGRIVGGEARRWVRRNQAELNARYICTVHVATVHLWNLQTVVLFTNTLVTQYILLIYRDTL